MELSNYCAIAVLSILFLIGCLINLRENDIFKLKVVKKFQKLIYVLIFQTVIDCLFTLLEVSNIDSLVLFLIKSIELLLDIVMTLLVLDIFYERKPRDHITTASKVHCVMILDVAFVACLLAASIFGWHVFTIDEANVYHRGPLMPAFLFALVTAIGLLIYGIFLNSQRTQSVMAGTLFSFMALIIIGAVLRDILPKNNYDFLCMSVSMPFLIIYYAQVTLRIDPLTKLLNRQVYQRALERIDYTTLVVMIDANNFKSINDSRGHRYGDRALKRLASLVCKAYSKYAYCYRIGGDEFCAILKPGAFDKLIEETPRYDAYLMAANFTKCLDDLIRSKAETADDNEIYLKYGVSQGYGIFYAEDNPVSDIPIADLDPATRGYDLDDKESDKTQKRKLQRMSLIEVIDLADKKMYEQKELFRQTQALDQTQLEPD